MNVPLIILAGVSQMTAKQSRKFLQELFLLSVAIFMFFILFSGLPVHPPHTATFLLAAHICTVTLSISWYGGKIWQYSGASLDDDNLFHSNCCSVEIV